VLTPKGEVPIATLKAGDTVLMQQFYDANGNGVVDAGDICVRSEVVTDGQARLFNGASNMNLFRDEDGSANGTIAASIRFAAAPDVARGVANYIYNFSSPSNHFTATNIAFAVRSMPYIQSVQGTVKCASTNVPNAYVALIQNPAGNVGTLKQNDLGHSRTLSLHCRGEGDSGA